MVFPEPEGPIMELSNLSSIRDIYQSSFTHTSSPGKTVNDTSSSAGTREPGYLTVTFLDVEIRFWTLEDRKTPTGTRCAFLARRMRP